MSTSPLPQHSDDTLRRAKVLAVDDEPSVLQSLQRDLRDHRLDLMTETDPAVALERVRQEQFDLVISDCRMPGIDGVRLLTEVRRRHPHAVRIMLSGHADMQDLLLSINEAGIYRFVRKPWSVPELSSAVTEALQQRRDLLEQAHAQALAREPESQHLPELLKEDTDATVISRVPIRWSMR
jgi:DNA-binding NtrC family response regulator